MQPFAAHGEGYTARLTRDERFAIAQVAEQVIELLEAEVHGLAELVDTQDDDGFPAFLTGGTSPAGGLDGDTDHGRPWAPPSDPAIRRLLPDAAPTDSEVNDEFRRLTQGDLALAKVTRLTLLIETLVGADEEPFDDDPLDDGPLSDDALVGDDGGRGEASGRGAGAPGDGAAIGETTADQNYAENLGWRHVMVAHRDAQGFAGALTDIRLVVGDRLGIVTDSDSQRLDAVVTASWEGDGDLDSTDLFLGSVFVVIGYLQESLVDAMLARLRRERGSAM